MYLIKNGKDEMELRASAGAYRKLKFLIGCNNLKAAYFKALEEVDIDFLISAIECFGKCERAAAEEFVDAAFENGTINSLFTDVAEFLNSMGFFGDLGLPENESVIDYFKNPLNRVDTQETMARAMNDALNESVAGIVKERVKKDNEI